jgi:zinc protease
MNNPGVISHRFENGLTVLVKEIHHVPLVSHWVWYRVGSRNERPGQTGISHWVEHMQFKGTPRFPIHTLDQVISRDGGVWNALTYLDWTTYFETMPAHKLDIALELEADRMRNSLFDRRETERERTVVISERQGNENDPLFRLGEAMQKAAFREHPYRVQVIGELGDLQSMTRDDLYNHYRRCYNPANAVIALAGDVDADETLAKLGKLYAGIPGQPMPQPDIQPEGIIPEAQIIEMEGPGETIYLQLSYRAPAASDDDFFALMVLDSFLTGPSSLAMFGGGGISNKTSRLYQRLVEGDLAVSVSAGLQATIDPFLYEMLFILPSQQDENKVIQVIDGEIAALQDGQVSQEEIDQAIRQAKALFAYGSESITNQAFWLGYASMFADHTWFDGYLSQIERVTPERVSAVARRYLNRNQRVTGVYRPRKECEGL